MSAYNRINGVFASENPWLLTKVLREEWGYDGVVVSDWGAVHDPVAAVAAGLDLRMPGQPGDPRVRDALADGQLTKRRLTGWPTGCGCWPTARSGHAGDQAGRRLDAHHQLARQAAAESRCYCTTTGALLRSTRAGRLGRGDR